MPLKDYICLNCDAELIDLLVSNTQTPTCEKCGSDQLQPKITSHGGYSIKGNNSASVRPKQASSFKRGGK